MRCYPHDRRVNAYVIRITQGRLSVDWVQLIQIGPASPVCHSCRRVHRLPRSSRIPAFPHCPRLPSLPPSPLRHVFRNAHVLAPSRRVAPGRRVHRRLPRRLSAPHHRRAALRPSRSQYGPGRSGGQCPAAEFGNRRVHTGGPGRGVRAAETGAGRARAGHGGVRLRRAGEFRAAGRHGRGDRRFRLRYGYGGGRGGHRRPARSAPDLVARSAERLRDSGCPLSDDPAPRRRTPAAVRLDRPGRAARLARHGTARPRRERQPCRSRLASAAAPPLRPGAGGRHARLVHGAERAVGRQQPDRGGAGGTLRGHHRRGVRRRARCGAARGDGRRDARGQARPGGADRCRHTDHRGEHRAQLVRAEPRLVRDRRDPVEHRLPGGPVVPDRPGRVPGRTRALGGPRGLRVIGRGGLRAGPRQRAVRTGRVPGHGPGPGGRHAPGRGPGHGRRPAHRWPSAGAGIGAPPGWRPGRAARRHHRGGARRRAQAGRARAGRHGDQPARAPQAPGQERVPTAGPSGGAGQSNAYASTSDR